MEHGAVVVIVTADEPSPTRPSFVGERNSAR
jgi:hypothetical protein